LGSCPKHPDTEGPLPDEMRVSRVSRVLFSLQAGQALSAALPAARLLRPSLPHLTFQPETFPPVTAKTYVCRWTARKAKTTSRTRRRIAPARTGPPEAIPPKKKPPRMIPPGMIPVGRTQGGRTQGGRKQGGRKQGRMRAPIRLPPSVPRKGRSASSMSSTKTSGTSRRRPARWPTGCARGTPRRDSEGLAPLLRMAHLAVRGLRQDLRDVRDRIRNRFG
jgi:hypothetical protein